MSRGLLGGELVEAAINTYVALDPELQKGLAELVGKRVEISIKGTAFTFHLRFETDGVRLLAQAEQPADVMVEATPFALLRLLTGIGEENSLAGSEIAVQGEVADAQRIRSLLSRRHVDAEELLARVLGDVAAHQVGNFVRSLVDAGRRTTGALLQDLGEYLSEESRISPSRAELDALTSAVESLRDDAERLDKRILRLQQRSRPEQGA
ncbi:MAG: SCP2 sterol-binding domain-containing protein [Gammaproteobacteria bacterium]